jgi:hypothetical protein
MEPSEQYRAAVAARGAHFVSLRQRPRSSIGSRRRPRLAARGRRDDSIVQNSQPHSWLPESSAAIACRRLSGRMSVQTSSMHARHSCQAPFGSISPAGRV